MPKRTRPQEVEIESKEVRVDNLKSVKKVARRDCPYLSSIDRTCLDFDFEKVCSVTLSKVNVYACLSTGKFFQGRGKGTEAYKHALETGHYLYINLETGKFYCIPDGYEVIDASLQDISYNLRPMFTKAEVLEYATGSSGVYHAKSLDGADFIPGCVGLNNIKNSDYMNVVAHMIATVAPLRNFFLTLDDGIDIVHSEQQNEMLGIAQNGSNGHSPSNNKHGRALLDDKKTVLSAVVNSGKVLDPVVAALRDLIKKMHNKRNFKGIVSPHEFYQASSKASKKKFFMKQEDPVTFLSWLLTYTSKRFKVDKETKKQDKLCFDTIADVFEGEVSVKTSPDEVHWVEETRPVMMFQLEMPAMPLFKSQLDFIPQIPLFTLLEKYNGEAVDEKVINEKRVFKKFCIRRLPPYMIFHVKRFVNNSFFVEKNPTIVNFPLEDLDMAPYLHPDAVEANPVTKYNLVGNIVHDGKPESGQYKIQVQHQPSKVWYEAQDLRVTEIYAQAVVQAESYVQLYQRVDVEPSGQYGDYREIEIEGGDGEEVIIQEENEVDLEQAGIVIG